MAYEIISEEDSEDYEIYTCDTCKCQIILVGVGNDIDCPKCIAKEYEE